MIIREKEGEVPLEFEKDPKSLLSALKRFYNVIKMFIYYNLKVL